MSVPKWILLAFFTFSLLDTARRTDKGEHTPRVFLLSCAATVLLGWLVVIA